MNIGKKVKNIRIEKLMTQSELAGNAITRNMLSQIENGNAQPSLSTIVYLSKKLGVPPGYLLSSGEEEFIYDKTRVMKNIKKAYCDADFELCREMCLSSFDEYDDELELLLTDCCIFTAEDFIKNGKLRLACDMLDEGIRHSKKTIYSTISQTNKARVMFHMLKSISPLLDSNEIDTDDTSGLLNPIIYDEIFLKYISIVFNKDTNYHIDNFKVNNSYDLTEYDKLFSEHLRAREYMESGEYEKATTLLRYIIDGSTVPQRLLLYICCCDMEKCCKETEDYKGAYEFSNNKMEILEHMLADV